jgi:cytoskeleton protein RodZ
MAEIGSTLRDARIRARIDMTEVETRTKIRAKYLRAIENEEWDLLPGPVYAKSFLRTYGDYLGLDSRMLVDEFKRRYERPSDHEATPIASIARDRERDRGPNRPRGPRGPRRPMPPWAPIGLVLVAIVVALYVIGTNSGGSSKSPTPAGIHTGAHRHARTKPKTVAPAPKPPTVVHLQLVPTADVYVCLVNAHGRMLINEQTFGAGQTVPREEGRKLLLTLGNANVQVKVNGHTVPLAVSADPIRLLLTPTSTQHIPSTMQPTCP